MTNNDHLLEAAIGYLRAQFNNDTGAADKIIRTTNHNDLFFAITSLFMTLIRGSTDDPMAFLDQLQPPKRPAPLALIRSTTYRKATS